MSDLISRSALIAEFERIYAEHYKCTCYQFVHDIFKAMFRRLKNAPTVDAVELVRCKDCVYYRRDSLYCENQGAIIDPPNWYDDDFCSYGERREDG